MELKMEYKDLDHALKLLRGQVIESIPFVKQNFPALSTPEKIFNYLKLRVTYKKDPNGIELFQTLPTLLDNNFHGVSGAGDCDCFTIAALATLLANGFYDCGIVLVGRNPFVPVHIYAYVMDKGRRHYFDLTNGSYDYERFYPYKQHIPFKLNQKEKAMMLQLADGGPQGGYIYFPNKGVQVREDYFDNLSAGDFQRMCLSEGIDPMELCELSGRRADRRADKDVRKAAKKAAKPRNQRKMITAQSKAQKRTDAGQAKLIKARKPAPQRQMPSAPAYSPTPSYSSPQETEYEEEVYEEVEQEETPQEQYETEMEEMFLGEANLGALGTVPKLLLWGVGLTIAGVGVGIAVKKHKQYKRIRNIAA